MGRIHPLAYVDPAARIADNAEIGPFCTIGPHVEIAEGCRLIAHVHVEGHTTIGARTVVHPHASLGTAPQSAAYCGETTRLVIGADCLIREGVTMNIGTQAGGGVTTVGDRGLFMANAHVAHDCQVGSDVVFANCATLGGHCQVGNHVFIGGLSAVHQFTRIGPHAMIGGISGVRGDVIPFAMANGAVARLIGINVTGLRRRGVSSSTTAALRKTYATLFVGSGSLSERLEALGDQFDNEPAVGQIIEFIRTRGKRPLCYPRAPLKSSTE